MERGGGGGGGGGGGTVRGWERQELMDDRKEQLFRLKAS